MTTIHFTNQDLGPDQLYPFLLTRPAQELRVGILTIREKWELAINGAGFDKLLNRSTGTSGLSEPGTLAQLLIPGNLLPTSDLVAAARNLTPGTYLQEPGGAALVHAPAPKDRLEALGVGATPVPFMGEVKRLRYAWHISQLNAWAIGEDWKGLSDQIDSFPMSASNWVTGGHNIFLESGVVMEYCYLNANEGPIYIGKNALVMEGSALRGPVAVGEGAVVKMGARLYGGTTIGPYCTAGGEIKNSVLFAFSNKAHDGYLGDAVIGEWCNLGAGTTNSNLTNNASEVMVYTPSGYVAAGLKCGVLMGDYSRTAINTAINTGTVIGVSCNVHGGGLTPKFIPSFSWGIEGTRRYDLEKALEHISNWKRLKHKSIGEREQDVLRAIFDRGEG